MARSEKEPGRSYRMDQTTYSTYYHGLEEQAKSRYREKLAKIGALSDPWPIVDGLELRRLAGLARCPVP